tara:strand:+ start:4192 stop:5451 length:1260 start_codon:yes stop_codon:yes gene_type:complete
MATFTEKDKTTLFVGKGVAITTGNISTLNDGEIGIFNKSKTTRLLEATTDKSFTIVEGKGTGTPFTSDTINVSEVTKVIRKTYQAATEKVDYVGYNGASGAIEAINDNLYFVRLHIDQSITTSQGGGILVKHGQFKSDANALQVEIANGLVSSFINNFSREAKQYIKFERVTSSTVTASTSGAITVVNGSKYVTAATDIDNGGAVVGDYLSLNGVAYKIKAKNIGGNLIAELDIPYQGASAVLADSVCGFITVANAAAGNWGIKLTGMPLKFAVGKTSYKKANWKTTLQNFGTSVVTESVGAYPGSGTYEQAAELEFFYKGNDGEYLRMGAPNVFAQPVATVVGSTYHTVVIEVAQSGGTTTQNKRSKSYMFLIPTGAAFALAAATSDITDVLEVLLAGKTIHNGTAASVVAAGTIALT